MLLRLLLLLTILPMVELMLLVKLHQLTNWPTTIGVVLLTGVVGTLVARWQGWQTVARIQNELRGGRVPGDALLDGVLILAAGLMLVTPGLLTDACGFLLLVPPVRHLMKAYLTRRFRHRFTFQNAGAAWSDGYQSPPGRDEIIDARVVSPPRVSPLSESPPR